MDDVHLLAITSLKSTAEVETDRVHALTAEILRKGRWTHPILVDDRTLAVVDGHHRLATAIRLKLVTIPAVLIDDAEGFVTSPRPGFVGIPLASLRGGRCFAGHIAWIWTSGDPAPHQEGGRYGAR